MAFIYHMRSHNSLYSYTVLLAQSCHTCATFPPNCSYILPHVTHSETAAVERGFLRKYAGDATTLIKAARFATEDFLL